jgi:hypothetical protein
LNDRSNSRLPAWHPAAENFNQQGAMTAKKSENGSQLDSTPSELWAVDALRTQGSGWRRNPGLNDAIPSGLAYVQ